MTARHRKKERGRPLKKLYPPRVDATAEEIAQAMFATRADHDWEYLKSEPEYRCVDCGREIHYPDTLYRDGHCEACQAAVHGLAE